MTVESIKKVFEVKKTPFPWKRAICAAICSGFPILVGVLTGHLSLGMLSSIGAFSYLYVFNEPYAHIARKMACVVLGISLCVGLGTLVASSPFLVVLSLGIIGFVATFLFGVFKIKGPAAIFFVLSFVMTTGMTIDPSQAFTRFFVVFLGGAFSFLVSTIGWVFNPHGPETNDLIKTYNLLSKLCASIGKSDFNNIKPQTVASLKDSEEILSKGHVKGVNKLRFSRLNFINKQANKIYIELVNISRKTNEEMPLEISDMIKDLSSGIKIKKRKIQVINLNKDYKNSKYQDLLNIIYETEKIMNLDLKDIKVDNDIFKPSLKMRITKAFDKDSIVFINSIKYSVILSIAALIAFSLPFTRAYWIPLTCASVMLGSTIMSTFHRAVQRFVGTFVGVLIAAVVLSMHPKGFMIVILSMVFIGVTELLIVRNYALAVMFITPNALLVAETSTNIHNIYYFASGRVVDIGIGALIALIGIYITCYNSSSNRLEGLISKVLRSQQQLIVRLFLNKNNSHNVYWGFEKMEIHLSNLKLAFNSAMQEVNSNREKLIYIDEIIKSLEHISYLIKSKCFEKGYINIEESEMERLLFIFETMATYVEQKTNYVFKEIPSLEDISEICEEINKMQKVLCNVG